MPRPVFYRVIEPNIQALSNGEMRDLVSTVSRQTKIIAKFTAPVRDGKLMRSINHNNAKPSGYLEQEGGVYTNAKHARYVLEGTGPWITAKGGKWMKVPKNRSSSVRGEFLSSRQTIRKQRVRGQRKNDFFTDALNSALAGNANTTLIIRAI